MRQSINTDLANNQPPDSTDVKEEKDSLSTRIGATPWMFAIAFLTALSAYCYFLLFPMINVIRSSAWSAIDCKVLVSEIEETDSDSGSQWSAHIVYQYSVDGKLYKSSEYSFFDHAGRQDVARQVIERYPKDLTATCYVNPTNPNNVVLDRTVGTPAVVLGIGSLGFVVLFGWVTTLFFWPSDALTSEINKILSPGTQLYQTENASWIFILFTLTIPVVIGYFFVPEVMGPGSLLRPLPIFQILGLILGGLLIAYFLMDATNPTIEIALPPSSMPRGQSIKIPWRVYGRVSRLKSIQFTLACVKKKSEKLLIGVFEVDIDQPDGVAEFTVPEDFAPACNNEEPPSQWRIVLIGNVKIIANVVGEFPIHVV